MEKWIEDAKALRDDDVLLILAGNKSDLGERRQVSFEEGQEYAQKMNLLFFETSAKTGANIKTLFNELAKKLTGIETNPISNSDAPHDGKGFVLGEEKDPGAGGEDKEPKKKKKCC